MDFGSNGTRIVREDTKNGRNFVLDGCMNRMITKLEMCRVFNVVLTHEDPNTPLHAAIYITSKLKHVQYTEHIRLKCPFQDLRTPFSTIDPPPRRTALRAWPPNIRFGSRDARPLYVAGTFLR